MEIRVAIGAESWRVVRFILVETNRLPADRAFQGAKVAIASKNNPCRSEGGDGPVREVQPDMQEAGCGYHEWKDCKSHPDRKHQTHDDEGPTPAPPACQIVLDGPGHGARLAGWRYHNFRRNTITSIHANIPSPMTIGSCLQASCRRAQM
jgi:hypothetical protein